MAEQPHGPQHPSRRWLVVLLAVLSLTLYLLLHYAFSLVSSNQWLTQVGAAVLAVFAASLMAFILDH